MRTIRLNGSGPFADKIFYGQMIRVTADGYVAVLLDDDAIGVSYINPKTGATVDGFGGETDFLMVGKIDLPRVDEFFVLMTEKVPESKAA